MCAAFFRESARAKMPALKPLDDSDRELPGPFLGGWYLLVPILAWAWTRGLWAPDEPRYAQIAKEAWDTQSFLVLHLCGDLYPDKPPLVYWLAGTLGKLTNWSEFALRVPSILATIGSAWLCTRIARLWLGETTARWCVPFYLGTIMVLYIGGRLQLDPIMSCACLAAIALMADDRGGERAIVRRTWLAGIACGLGALAKGPIAWVAVGFAVIAWMCLPRGLRHAPRRPWQAWLSFVLLSMLPVAVWAACAIAAEPALMKPLLFGQHIGRIAEGTQHPGPIWDHLVTMPVQLMPWTPLVVLGLLRAVRSWRTKESPGIVRIAVWFAVVFVFFSVIPPKRDLYLLPIYPAAALLAAFEFEAALSVRRLAHWVAWTSAGLGLAAGSILACAPLLAPIARRTFPDSAGEVLDLEVWAWRVVPIGVVLAAGCVVALIGHMRARPRLWCDALGLGLAAALTAATVWVIPPLDAVKSARALAELVRARPERPTEVICVGVRPEGIRFYGGVPAVKDALVAGLEREGAQFLGVCAALDFARLSPEDRSRFKELARGQHSSRVVLVLGRADP